MYCIYCGRLGDDNGYYACDECKQRVARVDRMIYILQLLAEAYPHVTNIRLREKIEVVLPPDKLECVK